MRGAALVAAVAELALDDPPDGEEVDARLAVEAVVLGGDERLGEVLRDVRSRIGDAVLLRLRPRQPVASLADGVIDPEGAGGQREHDGQRPEADGGALEVAAPATAPRALAGGPG